MQNLPLVRLSCHLLVSIGGRHWLLDTGSPESFGDIAEVSLDGKTFAIAADYMGLTASQLSGYLGHTIAGLLGADVLNSVDVVIHVDSGIATVSNEEIELQGEIHVMQEFMSIPIIDVKVGDQNHRMFFDTGAQISYFQNDSLDQFPERGVLDDFFPGMGEFQTDTYDVPMGIGSTEFLLRCGSLPGLMGMALTVAGTEGIVGNEVCVGRVIGYFARRSELVFS